MTGTITRVVADRGFGFIKGDNGTDYSEAGGDARRLFTRGLRRSAGNL